MKTVGDGYAKKKRNVGRTIRREVKNGGELNENIHKACLVNGNG